MYDDYGKPGVTEFIYVSGGLVFCFYAADQETADKYADKYGRENNLQLTRAN